MELGRLRQTLNELRTVMATTGDTRAITQQNQPVTLAARLELLHLRERYSCTAMNADKTPTEVSQQTRQRSPHQGRALGGMYNDVVVGGLQPQNVGHRHHVGATTIGNQQLRRWRFSDRTLRCSLFAQSLKATRKSFRLHGLEQVIKGGHVKSTDGIVLERCGEDHYRSGVRQGNSHVETADTGHLHIKKDHIGPQFRDLQQGLFTVNRFADDLNTGKTRQQTAQALSCW